MGGVIDDIAGLWGEGREDKAIDQQNRQLGQQAAMWERQFGSVNDALRGEMMKVLGYTPDASGKMTQGTTNTWLDKFKGTMRGEIESGIRPGEESAKAALLERVRANPRGMSSQSYAKGLKDIVKEGSAARGTAYRSGMTQAELTPFNMAMSFMGRTPFAPNVNPTYPPDYKVDTAGLKMLGGGLGDMVKAGSNRYSSLFGPRETGASGFEDNPGFAPTEDF
jgi:hypothetical protein